ncbi:ABC transporter permease [Blastochloris tepida]|uniref:ABC transporter n=1 Tax=Blastochloris tepida TaxID=2233851 RepID=A0A348G3A6_9HYPH|nr:ABC transporter permease [Blastochloris tepida]BBF94039.1 ABC transporter [Blastochloris tepida]
MSLVLDIAFTHVRARARQTLVAIFGVATGVGFSIMMAALMQGSQVDFINKLVDAMPHIAISDERPAPPVQPAERAYDAAAIHGLTPETRRLGIKNPLATMAALESWVPGEIGPGVITRAIIRYAGRDVSVTINGIDPMREPKISTLATKMRQGSLLSLYRATNAIILGSRLATKIGARVGSTISLTTTTGGQMTAEVVGISHIGIRTADETTAYTLIKTAQILQAQTGIINDIRIRLDDPMIAKDVADRIIRETNYQAVAWMEAQEELLSAFQVRNIIMTTVVGAILLVASFGTYNIISTITHEKARDIAIMKSLGFREVTVRRIFVVEALTIGTVGAAIGCVLGYALCLFLGSFEFEFTAFTDMTRIPLLYSVNHYLIATGVALVSSGIAGYFPARKAARVHPVEIIRGAA